VFSTVHKIVSDSVPLVPTLIPLFPIDTFPIFLLFILVFSLPDDLYEPPLQVPRFLPALGEHPQRAADEFSSRFENRFTEIYDWIREKT